MNSNFCYQHDFNDFVEILVECDSNKTFSWAKKWLIIQNNKFTFLAKRPASDIEISQAEEVFLVDKPIVKCYKEYKTAYLKNKKNYVCAIASSLSSNSNVSNSTLIFAVKSEKIQQNLTELFDSRSRKFTFGAKKNLSKKVFAQVNLAHEKTSYNTVNLINENTKSSSEKKENEIYKDSQTDKAKGKENFYFAKSSLETNIPKRNNTKITKHKKNFSCGNFELPNQTETETNYKKDEVNEIESNILSTEIENHTRFKFTNSFLLMDKEKKIEDFNKTCRQTKKITNRDPNLNKESIYKFKSNENSLKKLKSSNNPEDISLNNRKRRKFSCQLVKTPNYDINENENKNSKSSDSLSSLEKINPLLAKNTPIVNNEENSSLSKIINNMLISSKKVYKFKQRVTDSFIYLEGEERNAFENTQSSSKLKADQNNSRSLKRTKQLNKIIKLSLPITDNSNESREKIGFHFSRLNFNQSLIQNEGEAVSATLNINLSQEEISFDDKEREGEEFKSNRLSHLIKRIENLEDYVYDSYTLKKLLKSYNLKKKDIGLIYNGISNSKQYLKSQLLTEMIAYVAKFFLKQSIIKSLEIVLKEKEINKSYFVNSSHQHSIEYCIVDIFNTFLGSNKESDEFYSKILPNYLSEIFSINFHLNLKNQISIPNLFVLMEYHNRIYFNDNIDINFGNASPFVVQDIKYISPYQINKWYKMSMDSISSNGHLNNPNNSTNVLTCGTTNIKRMKYNNFEMKDSFDKMLQQLKDTEKTSEEMRISLVKNIYFHIFNKRIELALKLCDFYFQKYADTIFLNPIIYLILCEIYSEISGIKLARLIFEKAIHILRWQFPGDANPLLIDLNYTFSLILMKHSVNVLEDNSNLENKSLYEQYHQEILDLLEKSKSLCEQFFDVNNEKKLKIVLQMNLVKFSNLEFEINKTDSALLITCLEEVLTSLDILHKKELYREEAIYLNLFSDILSNCCIIEDEIKIVFLQRLHEVKKIIKLNGKP